MMGPALCSPIFGCVGGPFGGCHVFCAAPISDRGGGGSPPFPPPICSFLTLSAGFPEGSACDCDCGCNSLDCMHSRGLNEFPGGLTPNPTALSISGPPNAGLKPFGSWAILGAHTSIGSCSSLGISAGPRLVCIRSSPFCGSRSSSCLSSIWRSDYVNT